MAIEILFKDGTYSVRHVAFSAYQEGDFYCVKEKDTITKYPINNILKVIETYCK